MSCCKSNPPNFIEKFSNFTNALIDHAKDGFKKADQNIRSERMRICLNCEEFHENWCLKCGCYLPEKTKWCSSECPLNKWSKC